MGNAQLFNITKTGLAPAGPAAAKWLREQNQSQIWVKPVSNKKSRSLDQNALQWKWYGEIGETLGETPGYAHSHCKLHLGVPILRRDSEHFQQMYDRYIKWLPYEEKIKAVELISVTSLFTPKQATEYMESIIKYCAENGIPITLPKEND